MRAAYFSAPVFCFLLLNAQINATTLEATAPPSPVVIADVNLSPGPDSRIGDAASVSTGQLMGGVMDNFTFGRAGISTTVGDGLDAFTIDQTDLFASGETFSAGPFTSTAAIGTGTGSGPYADGAWTIDVVAGAGEAGMMAQIEIEASITGSVGAFGDNLQASADWSVTTNHGSVMAGSAESLSGIVNVDDANCITFLVPVGSSFALDVRFSVSASGNSNGPSNGGDSFANITAASVTVSSSVIAVPPVLVTPVSQDRTISCNAFVDEFPDFDDDSDADSAADLGLFTSGVSASASTFNGAANGSATQNSEFLDNGIAASGSAAADAFEFFPAIADGHGTSMCSMTFSVASDVRFFLNAHVGAFDDGFASVALNGPGGTIVSEFVSGPSEEADLLADGTLAAGEYTLSLVADADAFGNSFGFAEYMATLELAEGCCDGADANCDDIVDLNDVAPFVDAILENGTGCSSCQGDVNGDGLANGLDVAPFVVKVLP